MIFKKAGSNIFGVQLSAKERKVLDEHIRKEIAKYDRQNIAEIDAIVLWVLHQQCGMGKRALRKFYDSFHEHLQHLLDYYEMGKEDDAWLCTEMLKTIGVDIVEWHKETTKGARDYDTKSN